MAVKPLTQPAYWATDAVYTTGPFIGQPQKVLPPGAFAAEGHRPGALFPTPAEYENSQQYNITGLARWTFAGSAAGAADAHPLETDSNGETQVERARVVPANPNSYALFVQAPPGAGFAVQATGGSLLGDATIVSETSGPGAAFEALAATAGASFLSNRSATGNGLEITHAGSGNAVDLDVSAGSGGAIVALGNATATCAVITGGAGQAAVIGISGTNAPSAVGAIGTGTAIGLDATGGAGSAAATGARGSAVHVDAVGLHGRSAAAASNTGTGVTAEGRGSGAGLRAIAAAFHAAIFQGDVTAPLFAAVRLMGADSRPTTVTGGSIDYSTTEEQLVVGNPLDNSYRAVWTTGPGKVTGVDGNNTATASAGPGTWVAVAAVISANGDAPRTAGGRVVLRFRCEARSISGVATTVNVQIVDLTAGVPLVTRAGTGGGPLTGYRLESSTSDWQRSIVLDFETTIPVAGDRAWAAYVANNTGVQNIQVRDAILTADGLY